MLIATIDFICGSFHDKKTEVGKFYLYILRIISLCSEGLYLIWELLNIWHLIKNLWVEILTFLGSSFPYMIFLTKKKKKNQHYVTMRSIKSEGEKGGG